MPRTLPCWRCASPPSRSPAAAAATNRRPPRAQGGRELRARPGRPRRRGGVRRHDQGAAEAVHRRRGRDNPEVKGRSCGDIMSLALRSIPTEQLQQFSTAKIESVKVTGRTGTFVYRLRDLRVDGKVARGGGRVEGLLLRARTGRLTARWPRAEALTTQRLALEPLRPEHARELAPRARRPGAAHLHRRGAGERGRARARYARQAEGRSPDGDPGLAELGRSATARRARRWARSRRRCPTNERRAQRRARLGHRHEPPGRGPRHRGGRAR